MKMSLSNYFTHKNHIVNFMNFCYRFWVGENGERLSNPFVLCLNLVNCKVILSLLYKFGSTIELPVELTFNLIIIGLTQLI